MKIIPTTPKKATGQQPSCCSCGGTPVEKPVAIAAQLRRKTAPKKN